MNWNGAKYLSGILETFFRFVPNLVSALIVAILGVIVAKILSKLLTKLIAKTKLDDISKKINEIEFIDKLNLNIKISKLVGLFVYYFLLLVIVVIATDILNITIISNLLVSILQFLPNVLVAFMLLILGILGANWLKKIVFSFAKSIGLPTANLISNLVFYFALINVFISVMLQLKINVDFLSTNLSLIIGGIMAAFALAYGLAARGVLSNIVASLYFKNKYNIGDHLRIGNYEGKVIEKDNFNLVLENKDEKIVIPLSKLSDNEVIIK